jgi:hypothetical protein
MLESYKIREHIEKDLGRTRIYKINKYRYVQERMPIEEGSIEVSIFLAF